MWVTWREAGRWYLGTYQSLRELLLLRYLSVQLSWGLNLDKKTKDIFVPECEHVYFCCWLWLLTWRSMTSGSLSFTHTLCKDFYTHIVYIFIQSMVSVFRAEVKIFLSGINLTAADVHWAMYQAANDCFSPVLVLKHPAGHSISFKARAESWLLHLTRRHLFKEILTSSFKQQKLDYRGMMKC